jgi:aprataxin
LQQKFGRFSAKDKPLQDVLDGVVPLDENSEPPVGRDWESEILVGIHTYPSMAHLHIHVTSREMYSERLKKWVTISLLSSLAIS